MQFIPFITIKNFGPKTLFFVALGLVLCTSCHTDDINIVNSKHNTFTAEVVEEITGDIVGYVYDTNGQPVSDATVMIYSASNTTSKDGHFYFKNTKKNKNAT